MGLLCAPDYAQKLSHDGRIDVGAKPSVEGPNVAWVDLPRVPISLHHDEIAIAPRLVMGKGNHLIVRMCAKGQT